MAGYHSFIGYPWIIDCLAKYDSTGVQQKPVPGQVVEFLRMPVNSEDCQSPEAVVSISDQKYYIRAVITKEAQQMLESEDEHFSLADIKNKMIILKRFSVRFTAVEDLTRCEFYLSVQHFSVLPMETNTVDMLNCNMEPGVRKKIKELWQNYMMELEINETSSDMNLSDVSLTQLLMVASEEKFSALKSIAEQCLELDPFASQDIPPQIETLWSLERKRNQENTERFIVPVDLLLIPPHEEVVLAQMTEFRNEGQCIGERADSSEGGISSQPYSTVLSTLSGEPVDEGPSSQSRNPWNKLQSLCVSIATSSDSQPNCSPCVAQKSRGNEVGSDPDSSTPDIFTSDADVSIGDFPTGKSDVSPLMFSELSSNPQQPRTIVPQTDSGSSNTSSNDRQGRSGNSVIAPLNLVPLTQDSPQRSLSMRSEVQITPVKSHRSEGKGNSINITDLFSLSDESNGEICWSLRVRKASKRKQTPEDLEGILSDLEHRQPGYTGRTGRVTTTASSGEEIAEVSENGVQTVASKQTGDKEAEIPLSDMEKNNRKTEQYMKKHIAQNHISSKERRQTHKPCLQFVVNPKTLPTKDSANEQLTSIVPATSKVCIQQMPSNATHRQLLSFEAKEKVIAPIIQTGKAEPAHHDGTPFQYKYKPPSEDLCARMKAIQIPADLCDWAVKMLSEDQVKVL